MSEKNRGALEQNPQPSQDHFDFLLEIQRTIDMWDRDDDDDMSDREEQLHTLLEQNLHLVDANLAQALQTWADTNLRNLELNEQKSRVSYIWRFSDFIKDFSLGNQTNNIEIAITGYKILESIYRQYQNWFEFCCWGLINYKLGDAYIARIAEDKKEDIENAIKCYQLSKEIHVDAYENKLYIHIPFDPFSIHPFSDRGLLRYIFEIQYKLGHAYSAKIADNREQNIEIAIKYYRRSLINHTKYKEELFPHPEKCETKKGEIQFYLGIVYSKRIKGNEKKNIEIAIRYYQNSLEIYKKYKYNLFAPDGTLSAAYNLGHLAFYKQKNWELAVDSYSLVITEVEEIRESKNDDQDKQEIISEWISAYQNIVQAYINLNQIDRAIEYVERSKARNLVNLLANRDLYPKGNFDQEVIDGLGRLRKEIIVQEKLLRQQSNFSISGNRDNYRSNFSPFQDNQTTQNNLNKLRQDLQTLITETIKPIDPSFELTQQVNPISFTQMRDSLPTPQTVLVEWYLRNNTLSAFIVTPQQQTPVHIPYTTEQLDALTNKAEEYLSRYLGYVRIPIKIWLLLLKIDCLVGIIFLLEFQWQNKLPDLLTQLAENLKLATIIERIKQIIPHVDQLILVPHRWLHLLPLHALTLPDGKCLLDIFPQGVSYAPSVQLLSLTQQQEKPLLQNWFAVQNPTGDLAFTDFEVLTIKPLFDPHDDILKRTNATKGALTPARLKKANCAHFSCHGYFNFENPELSALLLAESQINNPIEQLTEKEVTKTRFLPSRDGGSIDLSKCLTLGEIFGLDLRQSRLTVLSACETGLTDFRSLTDEYIGLPSGFLYAGSPNVVSSLWAVNDLSTAFLMIQLYQNLQDKDFHDSVPIALNQAQLWLKNVTKEKLEEWGKTLNLKAANQAKFETAMAQYEAHSRPFASPYYWSAFCAVGY